MNCSVVLWNVSILIKTGNVEDGNGRRVEEITYPHTNISNDHCALQRSLEIRFEELHSTKKWVIGGVYLPVIYTPPKVPRSFCTTIETL
jgi:hypothetical protein